MSIVYVCRFVVGKTVPLIRKAARGRVDSTVYELDKKNNNNNRVVIMTR